MKKSLILTFALSFVFIGCTSNEEIIKENSEEVDSYAVDNTEQKNKGIKSVEQYQEILVDSIGQGEAIENIKLEDNNIFITVELGIKDKLQLEDLALSRYSSITDTLLDTDEHLNNITIEFLDVGTITKNTKEVITNEYGGRYFEVDTNDLKK